VTRFSVQVLGGAQIVNYVAPPGCAVSFGETETLLDTFTCVPATPFAPGTRIVGNLRTTGVPTGVRGHASPDGGVTTIPFDFTSTAPG
jgi:hypothetical protein